MCGLYMPHTRLQWNDPQIRKDRLSSIQTRNSLTSLGRRRLKSKTGRKEGLTCPSWPLAGGREEGGERSTYSCSCCRRLSIWRGRHSLLSSIPSRCGNLAFYAGRTGKEGRRRRREGTSSPRRKRPMAGEEKEQAFHYGREEGRRREELHTLHATSIKHSNLTCLAHSFSSQQLTAAPSSLPAHPHTLPLPSFLPCSLWAAGRTLEELDTFAGKQTAWKKLETTCLLLSPC